MYKQVKTIYFNCEQVNCKFNRYLEHDDFNCSRKIVNLSLNGTCTNVEMMPGNPGDEKIKARNRRYQEEDNG